MTNCPHSFWGVFFVDASSVDAAEQNFSDIAQLCKAGTSAKDFKRWLTDSLEPWLLILDNADDPSMDISQYFPVGNRGTIIITTRNEDWICHGTVGSEEVCEMESEEAVDLLLKSSNHPVGNETLRGLANPIAKTLGHLALALIQAGASIRQRICSLEEYPQYYEQHRKKLLSTRHPQMRGDYKYTVYTTWEISLDFLRRLAKDKADVTASDALELLTLFGFFHFDNITEAIFKSTWAGLPRISASCSWGVSNQIRLMRNYGSGSWDPLPFREALHLLSNFSLIRLSESGDRISLHPLVHSWIRDSLDREASLKLWNIAVSTLAAAVGGTLSVSINYMTPLPNLGALLSHIHHCLGQRSLDDFFIEDNFCAERFHIAGRITDAYICGGRSKDAVCFTQKAFSYCQMVLGRVAGLTTSLALSLSMIYNGVGDFSKTIGFLGEKIEGYVRSEDCDTTTASALLSVLSKAYRKMGRMPEALALCEIAWTNHDETLESDNNSKAFLALEALVGTYINMNRGEEAVEILQTVINKGKEQRAKYTLKVLVPCVLLALAYKDLGQSQASLQASEEVIEILLVLFPQREEHLYALTAKSVSVEALLEMGQPERALPLVLEALDASRRAEDSRLTRAITEDLEALRLECESAVAKTPERVCKPEGKQTSLLKPPPSPQRELSSSRKRWKISDRGILIMRN